MPISRSYYVTFFGVNVFVYNQVLNKHAHKQTIIINHIFIVYELNT